MTEQVGPPAAQRWRNAGFWLASNLLVRFVGFLRSLLVARFLSPDVAGLGYLAISIGTGARALLETGSSRVIITEPEVSPRLIASAFWVEAAKGLLLATILCGFGVYALWGRSDMDPRVPMLAALLPLALGCLNPMLSLSERAGHHGRVATFQSAGPAAGAAILALLLIGGCKWEALPIATASGELVTVVLSHILVDRMISARAGIAEVKSLLAKGTSFLAMGMGRYLGGLGIDAILALVGALHWIAPFRVSLALVQTVLQGLPAVVGRASLSQDAALSRASGESSLVPVHLPTMTLIASTTAGLAAASFFALPPLALRLYGDGWRATALLIPPLCAATAVRALSAPFGIALVAGRHYRTEAWISVMESAVGSLLIGFAAVHDIVSGIWAMAAMNLLSLCWRAGVMLRRSTSGTWTALAISVVGLGAFSVAIGVGSLVLVSFDLGGRAYAAAAAAATIGATLAYTLSGAVRQRFGPRES